MRLTVTIKRDDGYTSGCTFGLCDKMLQILIGYRSVMKTVEVSQKIREHFVFLASKYLHKTLNRALFNAVCNDGSPLFLNVLHFINYRTVYCTLSIETELKF